MDKQTVTFDNETGLIYETDPNRKIILTAGYRLLPVAIEIHLPSLAYNQICPAYVKNQLQKLFKPNEPVPISQHTTQVITDEGIRNSYIHLVIDGLISSQMKIIVDNIKNQFGIEPLSLYNESVIDQVVQNPKLCDKDDIRCNFKATLTPILCPDGSKTGQIYKSTDNTSAFTCGLRNRRKDISDVWLRGDSICCSLTRAHKCPKDAIKALRQLFDKNDSILNRTNPLSHSTNFCIPLVSAHSRRNAHAVPSRPKRSTSGNHNRSKRNTFSYWMSGGMFTSSYTDGLVHDSEVLSNKTDAELRLSISENSKTLNTLSSKVTKMNKDIEATICETEAST